MGLAAWGEECSRGDRRGIAREGVFPALTQIRERHPRRGEACAFLILRFNFSWNGLGRIRTLTRHWVIGVVLLRPE